MSDVQLGIKISADSSKATSALDQVGNSTKKVGQDIASLNAGWAKLNDQFAKQTAAKAWADQLGQASQAAQKLKQSTENAAAAWAKLSQQGMRRLEAGAWAEKLSVDAAKTTQAIKALDAQIDRTRRGIAIFGDSGLAASKGINALSLATAGFAAIASTKALFEAARDMERLNGMMSAASGGSQAAAANLQFVTDTANRLGISMTGAADAFAQLTASAQGTALQGQATRDIFNAVAQASAALGKSSYDTAGMLTAISQMMSKGKVSAEELRGQLGERLPGAFNLAAKAMGVSTQALDEMLTKGEIMAADFLPKFAKVLDETYSQARFDRLNNEVARLDNAWTQFKRNLTDTSGFKSAIETLTGLLTGMNSVLEKSKQYGADAFKIMPNRADVARALAGGQTGLDPNTAQAAIRQMIPTSPTTPLGIAQSFQGMTERGNAEELTKFLNAHSGTVFNNLTVPWCARFVNAALDKAGIKGTGSAGARSFESFGKGIWQRGMSQDALADVQPGDIAVFTRKGGGHVGFVKAIDPTKGLLEILGGNQSNAVSVTKRSMQDLLAVRRPIAPGTKGEYEDFDKFTKRSEKEQKDAQREAEKRLRESTQRYIANLDDQAKAAQRQAEVAISGIDNQIAALDRERDAWEQSQQDKLDAAKGSYDEMARLEAERAAKLQDYAARELALIQQQYDARKRAMEAAAGAYQRQLSNPNLTDEEERRAKQGLADIQADLVKLANDRAQAEAKAGQAAMDANRGSLELAQKQREFIAGINADLEFQRQLYLQLKAAKQAGASTEGLAILRATAERSGQLPGAVSQAEIQRTEQAIAQTKIYEQEIANLTQSAQDRAESVREQQLRENAYWDQLMGRTESLANLWTDIYGAQAAGLSNLTVAMARYSKDVAQIKTTWSDQKVKDQWGDLAGLMEGLQSAQAGAVALSETMLAIRSTTQQGTKAYEDLTTAAGNFAIMGQWLNVVEGIGAVIHQLRDGDVYTAIPRALGVAAMVASMGVQTGVIGGAGTQNATTKYSDGSNNGVFGDSTAASESITKSLEIIRDNSSNDLNYSAAMLRALENIEAAMGGVTNTIIRGVQPAAFKAGTVMTAGDIFMPGPGPKMDPILSFLNKLMFNITRRVSDFGLAATSQALSDILKQGFSGSVYTDIETSTKVFGMTVAKSVKTVFQDMDPAIAKQFTLAFQSISTAIVEGGKAFGLTAEDFAQRMRGFIIDIEKMSTKDMTGEELQKKVSQMFSEQSDRMARRFMPGLGKFQQVGEGYFQTFVRVAEAVNRAGGELERLGIKAISYRNIERKQADVAAEIVRESLLQQTNLTAGVRQYVAELTGSAEDLIDAYKKLREATQGLRTAGLGTNVTRAEINAGGGLDAYTQNLQTYLEKFLTPGENLVGQWQNIGDAFTALGLKMPTTNAEFRKMVEGIDTSTEAGQKLRGAVLALAPGFADLASAMDDAKSALQSAYDTAKQQAQGLRDYLNSLKTGDASTGTGLDRYNAAKKIYEKTLEDANKGDPKAIAALQGVSSTFLELSKKYFAASGQYGADLASVQTGLGSVADSIEKQIKTAEDQYTWLKANTDALTSLADAMKSYETTLAKVNGIQSSQTGQSVNDANAANGSNAAQAAKEAQAQSYESRLAQLMRGVRYAFEQGQTKKAKEIRAEIERYIGEIQASGIYSVTWDGKRHDVSYRAMGGYTPPGWAVVGERGPELVNFTRPSRVYTASETRAALSDSPALLDRIENAAKAGIKVDQAGYQALLAELQAIRAEMAEQTRAQKMKAAA